MAVVPLCFVVFYPVVENKTKSPGQENIAHFGGFWK